MENLVLSLLTLVAYLKNQIYLAHILPLLLLLSLSLRYASPRRLPPSNQLFSSRWLRRLAAAAPTAVRRPKSLPPHASPCAPYVDPIIRV